MDNTENKTPSRTSPKHSKRGCLCEDDTYRSDCCDGSLKAQGIGSLIGQNTLSVQEVNGTRIKTSNRG
jgi:hypothetical protein